VGEGVGEMGSAVAEIVATGDGIPPVGKGVGCGGSGVRTSTLNVQPDMRRLSKRKVIRNFFMVNPFKDRRVYSTCVVPQ
jgi:hypothetical protein